MATATTEILKGDVVAIIRVFDEYAPEPAPYKFFTVAVITGGIAEIKGLADSKINKSDIKAMALAIKKLGASWAHWSHNGRQWSLKL
jgi:hypothetical protein